MMSTNVLAAAEVIDPAADAVTDSNGHSQENATSSSDGDEEAGAEGSTVTAGKGRMTAESLPSPDDHDDLSEYTTLSDIDDDYDVFSSRLTNGVSRERLRPYDVIEYTPAIGVSGRDYTRAQVMSVSSVSATPLVLSNGDVLSATHQVRRVFISTESGDLISHERGIYRPIEVFRLVEGGSATLGGVYMSRAAEYGDIIEAKKQRMMRQARERGVQITEDLFRNVKTSGASGATVPRRLLGLSNEEVHETDEIEEQELRKIKEESDRWKAKLAVQRANLERPFTPLDASSSSEDDEDSFAKMKPAAISLDDKIAAFMPTDGDGDGDLELDSKSVGQHDHTVASHGSSSTRLMPNLQTRGEFPSPSRLHRLHDALRDDNIFSGGAVSVSRAAATASAAGSYQSSLPPRLSFLSALSDLRKAQQDGKKWEMGPIKMGCFAESLDNDSPRPGGFNLTDTIGKGKNCPRVGTYPTSAIAQRVLTSHITES